MTSPLSSLTIRRAARGDGAALERLAALDSNAPLSGEVLVAETGGRPVAALSLVDGRAVSDPFVPAAPAVAALRALRPAA